MNEDLAYVYILANKKNGTLYVGITKDLGRRILEHKKKLAEGFTKKYDINKLMYYECFEDFDEALARERQLKRYHRAWKIALIEENNLFWKDLSKQIVDL